MRWPRFLAAAPPAMPAVPPDPAGQLLGASLLKLEINTILKDNMTAEPMPPLPHALLDLAQDYSATLIKYGVREVVLGKRLYGDAPPTGQRAMAAELKPTTTTFGAIRSLALARLEQGETLRTALGTDLPDLSGRDRTVVERIIANIERITDIMKRLPETHPLWRDLDLTRRQLLEPGRVLGPYPIDPDTMLELRKIWDVGTEEVVAQTTIHLTGDVLVRIAPRMMLPENSVLLAIHRDGVSTATGYWRDLMNAVVTLATGAARALLGGR